MEHSVNFETFKARYELNYITESQLRRWVALNQKKSSLGITAEEFKEITGKDY